MARRTAAALVVALGAAGAAFLRRRSRPKEHVDVYFDDGSMVSFEPGSPAGDRLLPLARRLLTTAHG
jgi:hypothetical protein